MRPAALVGASGDAAKHTARPLRFLRKHGYTGRIVPINASRGEVLGERAYPSLAEVYRAAANADHGFPSAEETAIAKAFCNQAGFDVANEAIRVMGGLGCSQQVLLEYRLRRCRGWMIAGGSIEILKNRIAEAVFERSFPQRSEEN